MKSRVATALLVVLVAVDVVLVLMALRPPSAPSSTSADVAPPTTSTSSVTTSTSAPTSGRPTTTRSQSTTASADVVPLRLSVVAIDDKTAWRSTVGSCSKGDAMLETTIDGGATWTSVASPAGAIMRVQPLDGTRGFVVGAARDCVLHQFTTTDGGATWSTPEPASGGWARRLDHANEVVTPQLDRSRPCGDRDVIDLSRTSTQQAEALCAGGDVKVTTDSGQTWSDSGQAPGGVALSNRLESGVLSTYVARVDSACRGIQIVKVVKGQDASTVACVSAKVPSKSGYIALSVPTSAGWLRVDDETFVADSTLRKWSKV